MKKHNALFCFPMIWQKLSGFEADSFREDKLNMDFV